MKSKEKFICSLPWEHLSVHPHGHASPCCEVDWSSDIAFAKNKVNGKYTPSVLNIDRDGIDAVMNSDSYRQIRKEMLAGDVPAACMTCYNLEQAGGNSKRQRERKLSLDYLTEITDEEGGIKTNIGNLELRLGNYCNLKCRGCNAESSTSWINDYNKLKNEINLPSNYDKITSGTDSSYDWVEKEEFYESLFKYTDNLHTVQISGGEPFLVDKHSHFLQLLIDKGVSKNIHISYITNANYNFDKVAEKFLSKLKHFNRVSMSISIDDYDKRNTYIRSLSNWNLTIKNLKRFVTEYPDFNYSVTQTISVFNFLYIEELSQFLINEGLMSITGKKPLFMNDNYLFAPEYQNVNILPKKIRQDKIDSIEGKVPVTFFNRLKSNFYNSECNDRGGEFLITTAAVDRVRREKVRDTFPELYNIIVNEHKI